MPSSGVERAPLHIHTRALHTTPFRSNPDARSKLVAEVDAFGRDRELHHEDLEKFPYVEVCARWVCADRLVAVRPTGRP